MRLVDKEKLRQQATMEVHPLPETETMLSSGADMATLDDMRKRVARGDHWAWCVVVVSATLGEFTGTAVLGSCSYLNAEDFKKNSGYYEDLLSEAIDDLHARMEVAARSVASVLG